MRAFDGQGRPYDISLGAGLNGNQFMGAACKTEGFTNDVAAVQIMMVPEVCEASPDTRYERGDVVLLDCPLEYFTQVSDCGPASWYLFEVRNIICKMRSV